MAGGSQQVVSLIAAWNSDNRSWLSLQLPCHKLWRLRSLQLTRLWCHLMPPQGGAVTRSRSRAAALEGSSSTSASSCAADVLLPQLRELRLSVCRVSKRELLQLSALSQLSQLHLESFEVVDSKTEQRVTNAQQAAAVRVLLQHLTGLSDLRVCCFGGIAQLMGPTSALQRLQRLELWLDSSGNQPLLAVVPVSLTALVLTGSGWHSMTAAAQLSRLTNLQHLSTTFISHAAVLAGLTWLRHLRLVFPYPAEQASTSAPALLTALGRLTRLQHLELQHCGLGPVRQQQQQQKQQQSEGDGYQCFSALTASTQLTALQLEQHGSTLLGGPAALDHMFPAGRVLPHLAVLDLEHSTGALWQTQGATACVGAEQVARIAAACPALQQLVLRKVTPPDFDTACLDQLPPGVTSVEGLDWQRHTL